MTDVVGLLNQASFIEGRFRSLSLAVLIGRVSARSMGQPSTFVYSKPPHPDVKPKVQETVWNEVYDGTITSPRPSGAMRCGNLIVPP